MLSWWRHQMEAFSALLALCAGNSPVPDEFPTQRPVTRSFDVFFDLRPNKQLSKHSWGWWFETLSCSLWRHCNGTDIWTGSWFSYIYSLERFKPLILNLLHRHLFLVEKHCRSEQSMKYGSISRTCVATISYAQQHGNMREHPYPPWFLHWHRYHDDVIKWKHFPRNWPFVREIHRSRWIPHTKASDAKLWCFLWSASE